MRQKLWIPAALAALAAGAACSGADPGPDPGPAPVSAGVPAPEAHEHRLDVDWVAFSEADLHRGASVVLHGRVVAQSGGLHRTHPFDVTKNRELTPEESGDDFAELPLTVSVFEVSERIIGADVAPGARIEIVQLGGRYADGCHVVPAGQTLLVDGGEAIVYVKPAGMVPSGTADRSSMYSIIGGHQGLIPVERGRAAPIDQTAFERHRSRAVSDVVAEIRWRAEQVRSQTAPAWFDVPPSGCDLGALEREFSAAPQGGE
jgi:hypothetical protein